MKGAFTELAATALEGVCFAQGVRGVFLLESLFQLGEALGGFFDKEQHEAVHQFGIVACDFAQVGCIEDVGRLEKKIIFAHRVRVFPVHGLGGGERVASRVLQDKTAKVSSVWVWL